MSSESRIMLSKTNIQIYTDGFIDGICYSIFLDDGDNITHYMHYHDYYEIVLYFGAEPLDFIIEGTTYTVRRGDIVFCNIFTDHMFNCAHNKGHERMSFGMLPDTLMEFSSSDANLVRLFEKESPYYPVYHTEPLGFEKYLRLIDEMHKARMPHGIKALQKAYLAQICAYLYNDCYYHLHIDDVQMRRLNLISNLVRYVDRHYTEQISMDTLSDEFNYSAAHLSRIFHEFTGRSLSQYVINKRIARASYLLTGTETINEIARQTGFENYSNFYKSFKKNTGVSPAEYREQNRTGSISSGSVLQDYIHQNK